MFPSYFDYILVHLKQKASFRPELGPKFLLTLRPNPARTRTRPEKSCPTYNSASNKQEIHWTRIQKKHRSIRLLEKSTQARIPPIVKYSYRNRKSADHPKTATVKGIGKIFSGVGQ